MRHLQLIPTIAIVAVLSLPACNKIDFPVELAVEETETQTPSTKGWTVSISATMGGDTKALAEDPDTHKLLATFETTDAIYVYNKTKNKVDANPLHPDQNGSSVTLTGTLAGDYNEGDELVLCYNSNNQGLFSYKGQKGSLSTVADNAQAEITISAEDAAAKQITGSAAFVNMQSIFGFNFTDGSASIPAKAVEVSTAGAKLVSILRTYRSTQYVQPVNYGNISVVADDPVAGTVYAALRNEYEGDDTYRFYVNDGAGHLYSGEKAAPAGKIVNGKFYSSTVTLTPVALPTVTLTDTGVPVGPNAAWDPTLVSYGWTQLTFGYANYGDLTISGNSNGSWFEWLTSDDSGGDRTITLDGATITNPDGEQTPLENQEGNLTLILNGDNSVTYTRSPAIHFSGSAIYFQGSGTLTITAATSEAYHCVKGIQGSDSTPAPTAASGYTLTISDGTDNGDGTTTWVYTVAPEVTVEMVDLGLPSGTLWAKYNLGVADPTVDPYGNYYAWGEATPKKGAHTFGTYQLGNGTDNYSCLTKYIIADDHTYAAGIDGKTQLEPADDAATAALGSGYCIPTAEDWMELWNGQYVTFSWSYITCVNPELPELYPNVNTKVYGILVRSKSNGNTIFLPAAGIWKSGTSVPSRGGTDNTCFYWSSTLYAFPNSYPVSFEAYCFNEDHMFSYYEPAVNGSNPLTLNSMAHDARCYGMPVRPVKHP